MIGALTHIVSNTALVVVLAVIATIVFVIAWPFWSSDAGAPANDAPRLRLKSSINATPSARSVEANIYRTETIFSQRKFGSKGSV